MSKNETAHELFSKKVDGNLNEKSLTKIKKKKQLMEVISMNLPTLVDFYFNEVQKKKDMDVYKDQVFKTVTSHHYFYKPVLKMLKTSKKKKNSFKIPKGLHMILMDSLERMQYKYNKKMKEFDGNGQSKASDMTAELLNEIKSKNKQQIQRTLDLADMLVEKQAKYFEEEGLAAEYAYAVARCMLPPKYLHEKNIYIYFKRLNATLIEIQRTGLIPEKNGDEENYINNVGLNLMTKEALSMIYDAFFNGVDRKVFLKGLTFFLLERKPYKYDQYNSITKGLYNAINEFMLEVLEGDRIINLSGKKLDKKDKEKMEIGKKELKEILKDYTKTRYSDVKAGNDQTRRITIKEIDPNVYPRISKIFDDSKNDAFEEIEEDEKRENNNNNRNNNNSKNNNNRNNNRK